MLISLPTLAVYKNVINKYKNKFKMEKKKLLFGLIEMNKKLYNILYALLCVCVLLSTLTLSVYGVYGLRDDGLIGNVGFKEIAVVYAIVIFFITKVFDKKHYA